MLRSTAIASSKSWLLAGLPLWLYIVFFKIGGGIYFSALPILGERVFPVWLVGLLVGASSLVQLVLDVPAGFLLDRYGYARFLRLGSFALACGGILLLIADVTKVSYILIILLSGLGWLFFAPGVDAYVLATAPSAEAGRFVAFRRIASSVGSVIGTVVFAFLLLQSASILGAMIAIFLLIATGTAFFLKSRHPSVHKEKKIETHHYYIHRTYLTETLRSMKRLNPASGMLAFSSFAAASFYGMMWFIFPLVLAHIGAPGALHFGLSIFEGAVIVCGGLVGRIADTAHDAFVVFIGLLLFATFGTLLGFSFNGWFLVFGFIASVGDELSCVSLWAWLNRLNHEHVHDGLVAAVVNFFEDLGWVVGPILAGVLYEWVGASWTMVIGSSFILLNLLVSSVILKRGGYAFFHTHRPSSIKPHRYAHKD